MRDDEEVAEFEAHIEFLQKQANRTVEPNIKAFYLLQIEMNRILMNNEDITIGDLMEGIDDIRICFDEGRDSIIVLEFENDFGKD